MPRGHFQRARQPAEKAERRQQLIGAAAQLLAEGGPAAVSLSAVARAAGLAKSNVYRYFDSREHILLEILGDEEAAWVTDLERALAPLAGSDDAGAVARAAARTLAAHPVLCQLVAVVAGVLEHNLSQGAVLEFKRGVVALSLRIGNALHAALPGLPHADTEVLLRTVHALVAGLWPMAHPAPRAAAALRRRELAPMRCDFEPDLAAALTALLRGSLRPPPRPG